MATTKKAVAAAADVAKTAEEIAADRPNAVADPAAATQLRSPSGAIIEPVIVEAVDVSHESVDANPRLGTSALQNAIDFNDAKRVTPDNPGFAGEGLDLSVYGAQPAEAPVTPAVVVPVDAAPTAAAKPAVKD